MRPDEANPSLFNIYNADKVVESMNRQARLRRMSDEVKDRMGQHSVEPVINNTLGSFFVAAERYVDGSFGRDSSFSISNPYERFDYEGTSIVSRIMRIAMVPTEHDLGGITTKYAADVFLVVLLPEDGLNVMPENAKAGWVADDEGRFGTFKLEYNPERTAQSGPEYIRTLLRAEALTVEEESALLDEVLKFTA